MPSPKRRTQSVSHPEIGIVPESNRLVIRETPRGEIDVPSDVYQKIEKYLPECIRLAEDDRRSTPHYPSLPLRSQWGDVVRLKTRNTWSVVEMLRKTGIDCQLDVTFEHRDCVKLCELDRALTCLSKNCADRVGKYYSTFSSILGLYRAGQFVGRDERQKFDDAALLCAAFPQAPIVIVVASEKDVEHVASELEKRLKEPIHRAFGIHARPECRITVATYTAFNSEDLRDAPFVIVPVWKGGYAHWMKRIPWGPYRDRVYFLRTAGDHVSKHDADGLLGRVGPVLVQPRNPLASMTFSSFKFGGPPTRNIRCQSNSEPIGPDYKRKLFWRHRRRNQAIASLACHLSPADSPVAVLVESLSHATELSKRLPGWSLVSNNTIPTEFSTAVIVTLTAANQWAEFRPRTLIYGSGGPPSDWLAEWLTTMGRTGNQVHVVDLTDGFDPDAARFAAARLARYRDAGMHCRPLQNSVVRAVGTELRSTRKCEVASRRSHCVHK